MLMRFILPGFHHLHSWTELVATQDVSELRVQTWRGGREHC